MRGKKRLRNRYVQRGRAVATSLATEGAAPGPLADRPPTRTAPASAEADTQPQARLQSPAEGYIGVLRFFDRHERRGALGVFSVVYPFVTIHLTYINANLIVRRAVFFAILATLALLTARALVIYKLRATAASAHLLATMFLVHGSVLFLAIFLMVATTPDAGVQSASPEQVMVMVDGLVLTTLWTLGFILLVSQRSNAESREAKEQRELIFNSSPDAVSITHLGDGRFVEINDGFTALSGYTRDDVMASSTIQLKLWKHPEERQKLVAVLNAQGHCANLEVTFQHKDGSELVCNLSARRLTLNGAPACDHRDA